MYPLHDAIRANNLVETERLLALPETDPNRQDTEGNTALHVAMHVIVTPPSPTGWNDK